MSIYTHTYGYIHTYVYRGGWAQEVPSNLSHSVTLWKSKGDFWSRKQGRRGGFCPTASSDDSVLCPPVYVYTVVLIRKTWFWRVTHVSRVSQAFRPGTESWRQPAVPDFVHALCGMQICIFCCSLKLAWSERV